MDILKHIRGSVTWPALLGVMTPILFGAVGFNYHITETKVSKDAFSQFELRVFERLDRTAGKSDEIKKLIIATFYKERDFKIEH